MSSRQGRGAAAKCCRSSALSSAFLAYDPPLDGRCGAVIRIRDIRQQIDGSSIFYIMYNVMCHRTGTIPLRWEHVHGGSPFCRSDPSEISWIVIRAPGRTWSVPRATLRRMLTKWRPRDIGHTQQAAALQRKEAAAYQIPSALMSCCGASCATLWETPVLRPPISLPAGSGERSGVRPMSGEQAGRLSRPDRPS